MARNTLVWTLAVLLVSNVAYGQEAATETSDATIVLDRLVITAGEPKVAVDAPQAVSVVDQEDLDTEMPTTVGDALTDLPGVKAIGSDRALGESFNIRGIGTAAAADEYKIVVNVDGAPKFHEQYRLGSLFTDPELYKRIEVLRGPASSTLYGAGALAGVINLQTKDASDFLRAGEKYTFREKLTLTDNTNGYTTSSIVAAEPIDGFEIMGNFIYRRRQQMTDAEGDIIAGSQFEAPSGLVKARYSFGDNKDMALTASYQEWHNKERNQKFAQTDSSTTTGLVDREVKDQTGILRYEYIPADNPLIDLNVQFGYTQSFVQQRNASRNGASTSDLYADVDYAYETWQLTTKNTFETSGEGFDNFLTVGVDSNFQNRVADNLRDADGKVTFHPGGQTFRVGLFAQDEFTIGDSLTLIPGVRVDHQRLSPDSTVTVTTKNVTETGISPKLAAHYRFNDTWATFGSVAYTERMPVLDEYYDNSSSNLDLEPEKSKNIEVGFSAEFGDIMLDRDRAVAKTTVFYNRIDKLIERASTSSPFYNVGKARIAGIEIESSYDAERVFARAAYSLIRGEDPDTNQSLNSIPADEIVLTLGGRVPKHDVEFGWRGLFARHQRKTNGTTYDPTPSYAVHDLFASYIPSSGPLEGTEFRLAVDNVTNKRYSEHLTTDLAPGRTVKGTVTVQF